MIWHQLIQTIIGMAVVASHSINTIMNWTEWQQWGLLQFYWKELNSCCHYKLSLSGVLKLAILNLALQFLLKQHLGSVALLSYFHKVLALWKFALLKCEIEVNPVAWIPWATSTMQIEIAQCLWPGESVLRGSLQFRTLKVLTLWESAKVKQHYLSSSDEVLWKI